MSCKPLFTCTCLLTTNYIQLAFMQNTHAYTHIIRNAAVVCSIMNHNVYMRFKKMCKQTFIIVFPFACPEKYKVRTLPSDCMSSRDEARSWGQLQCVHRDRFFFFSDQIFLWKEAKSIFSPSSTPPLIHFQSLIHQGSGGHLTAGRRGTLSNTSIESDTEVTFCLTTRPFTSGNLSSWPLTSSFKKEY